MDWTQVGSAIAAVALGVAYALRRWGPFQQRQAAVEPRADEAWKSEAEAQRMRSQRLEEELDRTNRKLDKMRGDMNSMHDELVTLRARPNYSVLMQRFDEHDARMMEMAQLMSETLTAVASAVIPPERIRDD